MSRILVTYRYRLLCQQENSSISPLKVITHEAYSPTGLGLCVDPARRAGSTHVQRPNVRA
ncbi:MAG: hypothetical protein ACFE0I_19690 [Elainellaceae cyanobacterium]